MARPTQDQLMERMRIMLDSLREQIREGRLNAGQYLPSEVELGKRFQLSKESVRRALEELVQEGAIHKIRRVGNRVADQTHTEAANGHEIDNPLAHDSADNPIEITTRTIVKLAYYPTMEEEAMLSLLAADFEREHPGIRVQLMPTPHPHVYAEHGLADVFTLSAWDALKLRDRHSQTAARSSSSSPIASAILENPFKDKEGYAIAVPFVFSPVVLCYNREHLHKCGLEAPDQGWTWYTLLKNARLLSRHLNVAGFSAHIQSVNRWSVFLLQNGYRFKLDDVQRASEDPSLWESLRIARDLIHPQNGPQPLLTESDADVERWFREGRVSMIMTTYFGMNRLLDTDIRYGVAPLPSLRTSDTLLLVTGLAVNRAANDPDAAHALVRYLTGHEAQSRIRRHTLSLPAHSGALAQQEGLLGNRPEREVPVEALWPRCKLYDDLQLSAGVLEAIREELKGYWSKLEDEAEASERLDQLFGLYR